MGQLLLILAVALVVGMIVFGVAVLITGNDAGLEPAEPDGWAVPLPASRPLVEEDMANVRFDTALRGYRMAQVDQALRRAAYDIGYKDELIDVLEAEVDALRSGRAEDAEVLRRAREAALAGGDDDAGTDTASELERGPEPVLELGDMAVSRPAPAVSSVPAVGSGPEIGELPSASHERWARPTAGDPLVSPAVPVSAVDTGSGSEPADLAGEPSVEQAAEPLAEPAAEPVAGAVAETPPEAVAETPAEAVAETPAEGDSEPDDETDPAAEAETSAEVPERERSGHP